MDIKKTTQMKAQQHWSCVVFCICLWPVFFASTADAQEIWESRKGYVRSQANLAPGLMKNQSRVNAYIAGDMDIYFDDQFSFSGSAWYSFSTIRSGQTGVTMNHAIFWGGAYHWAQPGRLDPYVMIQPGFGVARSAYLNHGELSQSAVSVVPLISASAGFNYYVGSMFHFLFRVQAVSGHVTSNMPTPISLNEVRCSVGLGYNFRLFK